MIHKIANVGDNVYQLDENEAGLNRDNVFEVLTRAFGITSEKANEIIDKVEKKRGEIQEILEKTAEKGVIVDMYEVDYPAPTDPMKETEDLASHLDERKDFITQYLYPQTTTDQIIIGLRSDILPPDSNQGGEMNMNMSTSKLDWRKAFEL